MRRGACPAWRMLRSRRCENRVGRARRGQGAHGRRRPGAARRPCAGVLRTGPSRRCLSRPRLRDITCRRHRSPFLSANDLLRANRGFETVAVAPPTSALKGGAVIVAERSLDDDGNAYAAILDGPLKGQLLALAAATVTSMRRTAPSCRTATCCSWSGASTWPKVSACASAASRRRHPARRGHGRRGACCRATSATRSTIWKASMPSRPPDGTTHVILVSGRQPLHPAAQSDAGSGSADWSGPRTAVTTLRWTIRSSIPAFESCMMLNIHIMGASGSGHDHARPGAAPSRSTSVISIQIISSGCRPIPHHSPRSSRGRRAQYGDAAEGNKRCPRPAGFSLARR